MWTHETRVTKGDPEKRKEWVKSINRKNPKTGKNWQPSEDDRVCSKHFVDGQPTVDHPCPTVDMGYNYQPKKHQVRAARKTRTMQKFTQYSPAEKKSKTEVEQTDVKGDSSGEAELKQNVDNLNKSIKHDHDYIYVCDCVENCSCSGCFKKQKVIDRLQLELEGLKTENALLRRQATKGRNVVDKFLKTDAKIRTNTGLPNKKLSITWSSMLLRNQKSCVTGLVQKRLFQPRFAEISRHHQKRQGHRGNCL